MTSGIYCIENIINKKKYVGYSTSMEKRWRYHKSLLRNNKHDNGHLQASWNKWGEEFFIFYVLETCLKDNLVEQEKFYIKILSSNNSKYGYNLNDGGLGNLGFTFSENQIINKSNAVLGNKNPMYGRKHSESTRKLLSEQRINNKNGLGNNNNFGKFQKRKNSSSRFLGVFCDKDRNKNKWCVRISINGKETKLGCFPEEVLAAQEFDKKSWEYFKDLSKLNFPEDYSL